MSHKKAKAIRQANYATMADVHGRFIETLRGLFAELAPAYYEANPEAKRMCSSCALAPRTDRWRGFDQTMMNLAQGLRDGSFACHENMKRRESDGQWIPPEDPEEVVSCAAFDVLGQDRRARYAYIRALVDRKIEDDKAEEILPLMEKHLWRAMPL